MIFIIDGLNINTQFIYMFFSVMLISWPGRRRQRLIFETKVIIQLIFKKEKKNVALTYNPSIKSPLLSQLN